MSEEKNYFEVCCKSGGKSCLFPDDCACFCHESPFKVGDTVDKVKGYHFPGTIVAKFKTTSNKERLVVELDGLGLLHIFSAENLKLRMRVFDSPSTQYRSSRELKNDWPA